MIKIFIACALASVTPATKTESAVMAFTCYADKCPTPGERITARFSVPQFDEDDSYDMANFIRDGRICCIDELGPFIRRVAVQFADPLPFSPAENKNDSRLVHI